MKNVSVAEENNIILSSLHWVSCPQEKLTFPASAGSLREALCVEYILYIMCICTTETTLYCFLLLATHLAPLQLIFPAGLTMATWLQGTDTSVIWRIIKVGSIRKKAFFMVKLIVCYGDFCFHISNCRNVKYITQCGCVHTANVGEHFLWSASIHVKGCCDPQSASGPTTINLLGPATADTIL